MCDYYIVSVESLYNNVYSIAIIPHYASSNRRGYSTQDIAIRQEEAVCVYAEYFVCNCACILFLPPSIHTDYSAADRHSVLCTPPTYQVPLLTPHV